MRPISTIRTTLERPISAVAAGLISLLLVLSGLLVPLHQHAHESTDIAFADRSAAGTTLHQHGDAAVPAEHDEAEAHLCLLCSTPPTNVIVPPVATADALRKIDRAHSIDPSNDLPVRRPNRDRSRAPPSSLLG